MDFSWTDRDDITAYIFKRFGKKRTALLGAYNTFQHDAVTRELGKVFGLPPNDIDKLQRTTDMNNLDEISQLVIRYSHLIKGFPSHLSVHSSGIIISEEPIYSYTATSLPPKGYGTTQFSMIEAEDIGLYKFDILSQRGLGKIKDTIDIVKQNRGINIDIHNIPAFKTDEKIKTLLRKGNTIGCFYVESPAMRMLLAKLRADDYLRLVAASSIIRPGVAKSGMMREYILRYRHHELREKARKALPELYNILEETYGVMVYQEDVIKVAHLFADLTLAEADYLRKGMSWKFKKRNEFETVRRNFFTNCLKKGHPFETINHIWNQIESFANFAFSKGHSASYAVESYQALFLKAHYPIEYMVATLNNGGGFYRKELYIHEARMHGANICLPCINNSNIFCDIKGNTIYLGLGMIGTLTEQTITSIIEEREANGNYKSLHNFIARVPVSLEQMRVLIKADTFSFTGHDKTELLWEIHSMIQPNHQKTCTQELFQTATPKWELPTFTYSKIDEAFDEMALLGFSLASPFTLLKHDLPSHFMAKEMQQFVNKTVSIVGYWVNTKKTYTSNGDKMYFGTFTDLEGNWIDTVHFPPSAKQFPFTGPGCYLITGKVVNEYDFISIEVNELKRLPMVDREL
jgi:DNA polymerase-3 subunit alpha